MNKSYDEDSNTDLICEVFSNKYFDQVIGHIEDIVLSEKFQNLHVKFLELYWSKFDKKEENKLEYMGIFEEYTSTFESFFIKELNLRMNDFDMEKFAHELNLQESSHSSVGILDSEIFELLYSFSNFQIFKDLMMDYRLKKEGFLQHLGTNILITKPLQQIDLMDRDDRHTYSDSN